MKIINPATGKEISNIEFDTSADINKKYERAKASQKSWSNISLVDRVNCIKKFADLLIKNTEELALEMTREVGKPINESRGEVQGAAKKCQFFIEHAEEILRANKVNTDGNTEEFLDYDPLGVITNISAWNYPYLVGVNIFVPALICGNAVLYKPSEFALLIGKSIERLLHQAGVPEDTFIGVYGDGKAGKDLCDLPLDGYFFTGSYNTGKIINQAVSSKLVPVGLELGGKDPLYVTDEIDNIDSVADSAMWGAFYNNGQSCCSVERIYVHEKVYDKFLEKFIDLTKKLVIGNPEDEKTHMGAITRPQHLNFLKELIEDAKSKGAELVCGGNIINQSGNFIEPTVLTHVNHQMRCMREETFGPVIGIQKVSSDEEAIKLMNDTSFGLTSAVFTSNRERGNKILKQINSGTGYLNCCDRVSGYLPWSGRGESGLGSTLSKHGLYLFCNPKGYHIRF